MDDSQTTCDRAQRWGQATLARLTRTRPACRWRPAVRAAGGRRTRGTAVVSVLMWTLVLLVSVPQMAHAAVVVARAEVNGDRLRIEGSAAPSRTITVDGVAMGTADSSGAFRIERSGYTPPADETVQVAQQAHHPLIAGGRND